MINIPLKVRILEQFRSQRAFAEKMIIHESLVSNVVRYRWILTTEEQRRWAIVLDCNIEEIFFT